MFKIELQKIFFLALEISSYYKKSYFNTNNLVKLANQYKSELVRTRADKKDYKYLDDTNFGGLRGNFSTLLTLKGFVKKGNRIVPYYSLGKDSRIINAISNGEIILKSSELSAYTKNEKLKNLLETEVWLSKVRESQAHIKVMLQKKSGELGIERDHDNFKKDSVVKSVNNQYFIRSLLNNFVDNNNKFLEYNLLNYWIGKKILKKTMHVMLVLPTKDNPWDQIYCIKFEDLIENKPMFLVVSLENKKCFDRQGNNYEIYPLEEAISNFSDGDSNIEERFSYNWKNKSEQECSDEIEIQKDVKQQETWVFIDKFLKMQKTFSIAGKDVVDFSISSSGGCDVLLKYSGGTTQKLELEHEWKNYINHKHHENNSWSNAWLFAEQEWDPNLILKLFKEEKKKNGDRIPDVFLCFEKGIRKAYKADWENSSFSEIDLTF